MFYVISVSLMLFVLPIASVLTQLASGHSSGWILLSGKWFVFWAVGVRLLTAGIRQIFQPSFTARTIFKISDPSANIVVQELGFANACTGILGVWSLWKPSWLLPAALVGGLYYGLAGIRHVWNKEKNALEWYATVTDLLICVVLLAAYVSLANGNFQ